MRSIIEDLLPLYHEGLLREETVKWLEEQINRNEDYQDLFHLSQRPLPKKEIKSKMDNDEMFKKISRKLTIYQMIFVGISFFLAIQTSLLNESFGFILWYTVLGFITYTFYRDMKIVFLISFIPILVWAMGLSIHDQN
jgi:hypothetical protein